MLRKIAQKMKAGPWYKRNKWLIGIIYRALAIISYVYLFTTLNRRWESLRIFLADPENVSFLYQLLGAVALLLFGFGLYLVRVYWREQYGWIELIFAGVSGFFAIGRLSHPANDQGIFYSDAIAVVACLYLVVRGYDNIHQALKEKVEKEVALRMGTPSS